MLWKMVRPLLAARTVDKIRIYSGCAPCQPSTLLLSYPCVPIGCYGCLVAHPPPPLLTCGRPPWLASCPPFVPHCGRDYAEELQQCVAPENLPVRLLWRLLYCCNGMLSCCCCFTVRLHWASLSVSALTCRLSLPSPQEFLGGSCRCEGGCLPPVAGEGQHGEFCWHPGTPMLFQLNSQAVLLPVVGYCLPSGALSV